MTRKKQEKYQLDFLKYADLAKDSDQDGLFDTEEEMLGTDPNNPDTDNDGMNDYDEIKHGRNPLGPGLLRDLFIPHPGNNYQPKSLQPKRLLFYGVTAVAVKFIALLLVVFIPVTAWLTPNVMKEESQQIIALTNNLRATLSLKTLQQNELLQQAALSKAQDMMVNQYFAHVGPDGKRASSWVKSVGYGYRVIGENLALGFASAGDVVDAWEASPTHYANLVDEDFADIGVAMVSGNYNGYDTTLVAQYFGAPVVKEVPVSEPATVVEPVVQPQTTPETVTEEPKAAPVVVDQPSLPVSNDIEEPETVTVIEPEQPSEVLAEQQEIIKPALGDPQLISPANEYLTKDNQVNLEILAINASKVFIWRDDQLILQQDKNPEFNTFSVGINLSEGIHSLQVEAVRDEQRKLSPKYIVIVDNTAPAVDESRSILVVDEPQGKTEKIIQATAYVSSDTSEVYVEFADRRIDLQLNEDGSWSGSIIISEEENEEIFNPVVLATLTATDLAGNQAVVDVGWENVKPLQTSLLNQYIYLKTNQSKEVKSVFSLGDWYYKILLAIAVIALALNVFVRFNKQSPKTVLSGMGFIGLILILLVL